MNGQPPPARPNFRGAAGEQGQENLRAAGSQSRLNNPNFYGIGGSQTVTYGPDGTPTINQSLSPGQQGLYSQWLQNQGAAGALAGNMLGSGQVGGAFDTSGLPGMGSALDPNGLPSMPGAYGDVRQKVIDAMMGRANEGFAQREDQTNSDLIARGIRPGTEAYAREMTRIDQAKNDARQQAEIAGGDAATQAIQSDLARRGLAAGEQGQQFGQQTTNRGMGMQELLAGRQVPMGELMALLNGSQFQMPNLPGYQGNTQVAPAPLYGAATAESNYDVDVWNALMQQSASRNNGLLSIGTNFLNSPTGSNLIGRGLDWFGGLFD